MSTRHARPLVAVVALCATLAACVMASSCNDPAANATVLDVTVTFDAPLAPEQLTVTVSVIDGAGAGDPFDPFVVPETPRALDGAGETIEVILPDDVAGAQLRIDVDGLSGDDVVGSGTAEVEPELGARTIVTIALVAPGEDAVCGDGVITEPEACDDEGTEDGNGCNAACAVEPGFSCAGAPSVCVAGCGDGDVDTAAGEDCDDGDLDDGDGCDATCAVEPGFVCDDAEPSVCVAGCGNGLVDGKAGEACDDGDLDAGDGCDAACAVEPGFACDDAEPSVCVEECGNGAVNAAAGEACDDDNTAPGDGCSATCTVEAGFACTGQPSTCEQTCDNGAVDAGEQCDDGGTVDGDGCSAACALEPGFTCEVPGAPCAPVCGDALIRGTEECDDDDTNAGDGCSAACTRELGFACTGEPSVCLPTCTIGGVPVAEGTRDPGDACRACQSAVDEGAFTPLPEGSLCNDTSFCNGAETCQSGACVSAGDPCSTTQPFCSEAADLCACTPASCDDGVFCDGNEICQADGACAEGAPPVCGGLTDVCSDAASACVECEDDGDCAAPNPSCFAAGGASARCTECPGCPCRFGEHDGGAGACVPVGTCSPGFARGFLDGDLDGIGAGAQLADCDALPFGAGVSATSTDCDDGDGGAFRILALFPDDDGDGFTGVAANECVGAAIPAGRSETASPPPFTSFQARTALEVLTAGVVDWFNDTGVLNPGGASTISDRINDSTEFTNALTVTDFDLRVPANVTIRGVVVHVVRRLNNSDAGTAVDRTISLVAGATTSANRASPVGWTSSLLDVAYGAPNDTWGIALTPADVNAATFGVFLEVGASAGSNDVEAEIAHVWIEVYTDGTRADCNDTAGAGAAVWTLRSSLVDVDVDRFTVGNESDRCVGVALPAGITQRASASLDCFDTNASAFPGQTAFFSVNRGDGSFDYDCDGNNGTGVDRSPSGITSTEARTCSCDDVFGTCSTATTGTVIVGGCGTTFSDDFCGGSPTCIAGGAPGTGTCPITAASTTVRCR